MTAIEAVKKGLVVILAAGGLAGPIAVIIYTSSRASADDVHELAEKQSTLKQSHEDLVLRVADDRHEVRYRFERLDAKLDRMIELLETPRRGR